MSVGACPVDDCPVVLFDAAFCPVCGLLGVLEPREFAVVVSLPDRPDTLRLPTPTEGQADATAAQINGDSTPAVARVCVRPAVGWAER